MRPSDGIDDKLFMFHLWHAVCNEEDAYRIQLHVGKEIKKGKRT